MELRAAEAQSAIGEVLNLSDGASKEAFKDLEEISFGELVRRLMRADNTRVLAQQVPT